MLGEGRPAHVDSGIPANVNTNQDVVLVMRSDDSMLFESTIRTRG